MSQVNDQTARAILSENLQKILLAKKWSVRKLARETEDPVMTVHNAVKGQSLPTAGVLYRIAEALDVAVDDLFVVAKKTTKSA